LGRDDEPYALNRESTGRRGFNQKHFDALPSTIEILDVFLAFLICDGNTAGNSREPLRWFFGWIESMVASRFSAADLP
jgi:hypothetical protein